MNTKLRACGNCDNYVRGYCSYKNGVADGVCSKWTPKEVNNDKYDPNYNIKGR